MLRARDAMDRDYAPPLDVARLSAIGCVSEAHFIRTFKATFGETPHRYLQRRRVERAMYLLRTTDRNVTDACLAVGLARHGDGEPPHEPEVLVGGDLQAERVDVEGEGFVLVEDVHT